MKYKINLNGKLGEITAIPTDTNDEYALALYDEDDNFIANLYYEETATHFTEISSPEEFYDLIGEPLEKYGTKEEMMEYLKEDFKTTPYLNRIGETYCLLKE